MQLPDLPEFEDSLDKEENTIEIKRWKYLFLNSWFFITLFFLISLILFSAIYILPIYNTTVKPILEVYQNNSSTINQRFIDWMGNLS